MTWIVCFALALVLVVGLSRVGLVSNDFAIAIALTSTSLGTLLPILKDSGLLGTRFGAAVLNHGAFGELGPIVAMACCWAPGVLSVRWSCSPGSAWW